MDEKISLEAVSKYADSYADKVLSGFFSSKTKITGPEILSLCNIKQINLFVIGELFKAWREETQKLKSAYFDNDSPEVKEALSVYMGVLSNHIAIDRAHFAPLLKKAVVQTLMVIFNPYDFFSMLMSGKENRLQTAAFREALKYLKVNKAPLERMLQVLEQRKIEEISSNEALAVLDQILEEVNFTPDDLDEYVFRFSSIVPLDPASFYKTTESGNTDTTAVQANTSSKGNPSGAAEENKTVRESVVSEATLNDRLNKTRAPAVNDHLRKISKIKDSLSINQKFMFTKVLFSGDFESFIRAVDDLDQLPDMNAALRYLEKHSSVWDRESREFHEFMEMVEKRFI